MGIESRKWFKYSKSDITNYGKLFINSEGGQNWEELWEGSPVSMTPPSWLQFYFDLETNKFQRLIENMLDYEVSGYQREQTVIEIKDLIDKIERIEPEDSKNVLPKTRIRIECENIEKFKKKIEILVGDVIENDPWGEHDINDFIILKPINHDFKDILLEGYYSIIKHYESLDQQKIKELENQVQDLKSTAKTLKEVTKSNEYKLNELQALNVKYKSECNQLKIQHTKDKETIGELTRDIKKLRAENDMVYILEDDLPDSLYNDMFALLVLNELDFLNSPIWHQCTREKVATVILNMLKISKKQKLSETSIIKYRDILLNPATEPKIYAGWQNKYGKRLEEVINKNFDNREIKLTKPLF